MNGFIRKTVAGLGLGGLLLTLVGCRPGAFHHDNLVDPCWPERYNATARKEVREPFQVQATNGHILDQTVWNWHFEHDLKTGEPTERLSQAGRDFLTHIVRRRPCPDPKVFVQTAQDLVYDQAKPEELVKNRAELDARRMEGVQRFLGVQAAGRQLPYDFQVAVHDPHEVGFSAIPLAGTETGLTPRSMGVIDQRNLGFSGTLPAGGGGGGTMTMTTGGQ